jgi:hypothetical protein
MTIDVDYEQVERLAGQGLSKREIAYCLGIGESTVYKKQKTDVEFREAIKKGRAAGLKTITNALFETGSGGNVTAQIFYLKNRAPDKWSDRREITGKDGGPIELLPFEFVDAKHPETPEED